MKGAKEIHEERGRGMTNVGQMKGISKKYNRPFTHLNEVG
jgi:hypothetical protein